MAYADYDFYKNQYFGNAIAKDDFPRLSERASDYIYSVTQGLAEKVTGRDLIAVQKAVCAVADVLLDEEIMTSVAFSGEQHVSNETVGSWNRSYGSAAISKEQIDFINNRKREALLLYLGNIAAFSSIFKVRSYKCLCKG